MTEADVLITYKIHPKTAGRLADNVAYKPELGFSLSAEPDDTDIKIRQIRLQEELLLQLTRLKPKVLIVGSNPVERDAVKKWREAVGPETSLMVIRRGVETGGIDKKACDKYGVKIANTPGINSGPVAGHLWTLLNHGGKAIDELSVIGVGAIGGRIAKKALATGARVRLFSPSLKEPKTRPKALAKAGLQADDNIKIEPDVSAALRGARQVVIAVPWRVDDRYNKGIIPERDIGSLALPATILSASNPGVFSVAALKLLNELCREGKLRLHIDTGAVYAKECRAKYPWLEIEHDVAFADEVCQLALDKASLSLADDFLHRQV